MNAVPYTPIGSWQNPSRLSAIEAQGMRGPTQVGKPLLSNSYDASVLDAQRLSERCGVKSLIVGRGTGVVERLVGQISRRRQLVGGNPAEGITATERV